MSLTREMVISYGGFSTNSTTYRIQDFTGLFQGTVQSGFKATIIVTGATVAITAANCASLETAFRTPYQACNVSIGGNTFNSWSHTAGTGFNGMPASIKPGKLGDSGCSRVYEIEIQFGMPADTYGTSFRRESTVRVTWTPDRRQHVAIDGVYTCNGVTTGQAQYLAAIGAYATSILTALGGTFDLLEESVENDDQNKVATFHRLYDEQFTGRNEAEIVTFYTPDRRRHVTISGKYSTVIAGSGARAAYASLIGAFCTTVLGVIGGTYDLQAETIDDNDADTVVTFSRTYDELIGGRKDGSYTVAYDGERVRTVTFQATYTTVTAATSARAAAESGGASWASGILSTLGVSASDLISQNTVPNDQDNAAAITLVYKELIFSEAGALPDAQIVNQKLKITRQREAPGDTPTAVRLITLSIDYSAGLVWTLNTNLVQKWGAIRNWILGTIVAAYQSGSIAVTAESVDFDPVSNDLDAKMTVVVATYSILSLKIDIADEVDQDVKFIGKWTKDPMDFYTFPGHMVCTRTITKTYRRLPGGVAGGGVTLSGPQPVIPPGGGSSGNLKSPTAPSIGGSNGEAGDDPYSFGGNFGVVTRRSQTKTKLTLGLPDATQMQVEDIVYVTVVRIISTPTVATT